MCECTPTAWIGLYRGERAGQFRLAVEGPPLDVAGAYNGPGFERAGKLRRVGVGLSWTRWEIMSHETEIAPGNTSAQG